MDSLFSCPVCGGPLTRTAGAYTCPKGHSFDRAKEGYVNLLPANQMHSKTPGDDKDMAAARTRFLDGGWYQPLSDILCKLVGERAGTAPTLLDAGCGEGYYTAALAQAIAAQGGRTAGVDLSKPSVKKAAKRCPQGELAVASVYHLPVGSETVDLLVDCFSPLAIEEFCRVLRPGGGFFYVVPGPRHLWELKRVLYDAPYENPEAAAEYPGFRYQAIVPVETAFTLPSREAIGDLFRMTPYYWKTPQAGAGRLAALEELRVTAQFRVHAYVKSR